MRGNR